MFIMCTNFSLIMFKGTWHEHSLVHSSDRLIRLSKIQLISMSRQFLVDVCLWHLVPHWWFGCIQLMSARGPLQPPLLPVNPSALCVFSFQEGDVLREKATVRQAWRMCPGQELLPPRVLVPSPESHCSLDLQAPLAWNFTSLLDSLMLCFTSYCVCQFKNSWLQQGNIKNKNIYTFGMQRGFMRGLLTILYSRPLV